MNSPLKPSKTRPLAVAVSLACWAVAAQAQTVSNLSVEARGSHQLDGGASVNLLSGPNGSSVDVLDFPSTTTSSAGLHTYGSSDGTFGSRSSGSGHYNVFGSFQFKATLTNDQATAQAITFKFYITPGQISNEVNSALTGTQHVAAGVGFHINAGGNSVWGSKANLTSDESGLGRFSYVGTDLYTGSGLQRVIAGGNFEVDLGILNPGQSLDLQYDMYSTAYGLAPAGPGVLIPEQTFVVPEHWVDPCRGDCFYGGQAQLVPGQTITIPSYTTSGEAGGSHASSGDPFSFNSNGANPLAPVYFLGGAALPGGQAAPFSFSFATPVPEPGSYALLMLGLLTVGAAVRRRTNTLG